MLPILQKPQMAGGKTEVSQALTVIEKEELKEFENRIETGLKTFREVGNALMSIRDGRLYRSKFKTFEDYCRERWGFARNYANKMIAAAEVVSNLGTTVPIPTSERQARPLASLPPEQQPEAWKAATEKAELEQRKVTAKDVKEEVAKIKTTAEVVDVDVLPPEKKEDAKQEINPKPVQDAIHYAHFAISQLERIRNDDPTALVAFVKVEKYINDRKNTL